MFFEFLVILQCSNPLLVYCFPLLFLLLIFLQPSGREPCWPQLDLVSSFRSESCTVLTNIQLFRLVRVYVSYIRYDIHRIATVCLAPRVSVFSPVFYLLQPRLFAATRDYPDYSRLSRVHTPANFIYLWFDFQRSLRFILKYLGYLARYLGLSGLFGSAAPYNLTAPILSTSSYVAISSHFSFLIPEPYFLFLIPSLPTFRCVVTTLLLFLFRFSFFILLPCRLPSQPYVARLYTPAGISFSFFSFFLSRFIFRSSSPPFSHIAIMFSLPSLLVLGLGAVAQARVQFLGIAIAGGDLGCIIDVSSPNPINITHSTTDHTNLIKISNAPKYNIYPFATKSGPSDCQPTTACDMMLTTATGLLWS